MDDRLAVIPRDSLPIKEPVSIVWNEYAVPYIHAENDADLAFSLGMVHAHLRLAQINLLRMVSQGRISESGGPLTVQIDVAARVIDFRGAAAAAEKVLSSEARLWLERYVEGLNVYQARLATLPPEYAVMGWKREPFTVLDILTIGRLASADVNWISWVRQLPLTTEPNWEAFQTRYRNYAGASTASFDSSHDLAHLAHFSKSGSNSVVLSGSRTKSGKPMIASDPHVGMSLPNFWLLVGLKSPNYHAVGITIPGVPIIALGRNESIAWGGTNMHSASSDLIKIPKKDLVYTERVERIKRRWFLARNLTIRFTTVGPVVSDALGMTDGDALILRWLGQEPSDEWTPLLKVMKSANWDDFQRAFSGWSVSGQNFVYADRFGNIGQLMAVTLPRRTKRSESFTTTMGESLESWTTRYDSSDLPTAFNPRSGFLVSANNLPTAKSPSIIGSNFSSNDRMQRLTDLVESQPDFDLDKMRALQADVTSPIARRVSRLIHRRLSEFRKKEFEPLLPMLDRWDGAFSADSEGALTCHLAVYHLISYYYKERYGKAFVPLLLSSPIGWEFLEEDLRKDRGVPMGKALFYSADRTLRDLKKFKRWEDIHRVEAAHILNRIPFLRNRFPAAEVSGSGSLLTVMKAAAPLGNKARKANYGAVARHISDMSDVDANYFVLMGGQDGWPGSEQFADQIPLWDSNQLIRLPMTTDAIKADFPNETILNP